MLSGAMIMAAFWDFHAAKQFPQFLIVAIFPGIWGANIASMARNWKKAKKGFDDGR
jgi:nitrate/nitrite transporter NarK